MSPFLLFFDKFLKFGSSQFAISPFGIRPEYIEAYQNMANLATKAGVERRQKLKIHTPLIQMTKAQIIKKGLDLGVDFSLTHSCYDPSSTGEACGHCDSCLLRLKGFKEAGVQDPIRYRKEWG